MAAIDTNLTKNSLFGSLKKIAPAHQESSVEKTVEIGLSEKNIPEAHVNSINTKAEQIVFQPANIQAPGAELTTPKWQSLDKVTALLTSAQKEGLDRIARKLMKHRSKLLKRKDECERITTNTILRALIENFLKNEEAMQLEVLLSENDVFEWVSKTLSK